MEIPQTQDTSILGLCQSLKDLGEQDRLYRESMREQWAKEAAAMDAFFARSQGRA